MNSKTAIFFNHYKFLKLKPFYEQTNKNSDFRLKLGVQSPNKQSRQIVKLKKMNENIASEQYQGAPGVPDKTSKSPQKLKAGKTSER